MLIMIVCLIVAVLLSILAAAWFTEFDIRFGVSLGATVIAVLLYVALLIMIPAAIIINIGAEGDIAANEAKYESLVYQLENNLYENDNDLGKKQLYDEITEWNTDLARGKAMQNNIWAGVFYPNIYDDLEFIELPNE